MPFVAMRKSIDGNAERIDITKLRDPKLDLAGADLACQVCGAPMHVRGTLLVRSHFAHNPTSNRECPYAGGESYEHLKAKEQIAFLLARRPDYADAAITYEQPVKIDATEKWPIRIADVYVVRGALTEAHEVQLAAITPAELQARTADYHAAGVDIYWWLGNRADNETNREWCKRNLGGYGSLNFHAAMQRVI